MQARLPLIAMGLLAMAGCTPQPPDCSRVSNRRNLIQCLAWNQGRSDRDLLQACWPLSPSSRIEGIWVTSLENSSFFERATQLDRSMLTRLATWLEVANPPAEVIRSQQGEALRAYQISLVGRQTLCEAHYGHMGVFPHEVIVDRIVHLQPLDTHPLAGR